MERDFTVGLGWAFSPELEPDKLEGEADEFSATIWVSKEGEEYGVYVFDPELEGEDSLANFSSLPTVLTPEILEANGWRLWEGL